jgi:DNA ligase D-like protein (predicted ligase)/DNA ligase D-like protein (predicted 3'-phosphoesterase)
MRTQYRPMLAQSSDTPFSSGDWIFEIKWDGIRAISYLNGGLSIRSRNGYELGSQFPELGELKGLARNVVLDGEIVVMVDGRADFQTVVERSKAISPQDAAYLSQKHPATYIIFDILEKEGEPLIALPLVERKRILKESVRDGRSAVLSVFVEGDGETYYKAAVGRGVEGIMAKKKDSPYEPGRRSSSWLKIKRLLSCDCVIFGFTEGGGERGKTFGALMLGVYDNGRPVYLGKVGTGFSADAIQELSKTFKALEVEKATLKGTDVAEKITWIKPELVAEIVYQTLTKEGKLRMPRFKGLRHDKLPFECTLDQLRPKRLEEYAAKRDLSATPEPSGEVLRVGSGGGGRAYVIQEHHARRLHYDLRLEKDGILKSWAVPKGMPENPGEKRLAIEVEDHPLEYGSFEGEIPKGEYGAGTVSIWDSGTFEPIAWGEDMIEFVVSGQKLHGRYALRRFKKAGEKQWLVMKVRDKLG